MKKTVFTLCTAALLAACATPVTTLTHPKTKQVARCGGDMTASMEGGLIGYHIQKGNDEKCVEDYKKQGFKVTP